MMRTVKVAFCGKAGSGKSAVAVALCRRVEPLSTFVAGQQFKHTHILSFSTDMYALFERIFYRPVDKSLAGDREFMQRFGTDLCRRVDKEVWIKHLATQYLYTGGLRCICVDDVRFLNEAEWLRKHGFTIVRVIGREMPLSNVAAIHASETEQERIKADITLENDGSLSDTVNALIIELTIRQRWLGWLGQ